uniref:Cytochrome c oxidase assembly protein COX16 homolog, mitochondrial n=1 Tax=Erpetoichthys calabaricus TaxID=27687 RepID=A0A8C4SMN1_ERPCA
MWKVLYKSKTAKYGVPMLLDPTLEAKLKAKTNKVTLESEYEKLKDANMSDWKNIRGPRPWENSREYQEQQRAMQRDIPEKGL